MSDHHTYKKVELVGSSTSSIEDAINNAVPKPTRASSIWSGLKWSRRVATSRTARLRISRSLKVGFRIASS